MVSYVSDDESRRIESAMFGSFGRSEAELFLRRQLKRYVSQFSKSSEEEIKSFVDYQRQVYLEGIPPVIGKVIACLNPTFVDAIKDIRTDCPGFEVYTRASLKENGYRMQLHRGAHLVSAVTRQFTVFDLRMFPELTDTIERLPVMIGDAELISRHYPHLVGFDRVEDRIPGASHWPVRGQAKLDDALLTRYLSDGSMFIDGIPIQKYELSISFHGLFAIAHPDTWDESREVQAKSLVLLCKLPVDYKRVDDLLDRLEGFIIQKNLNAKTVERKVVSTVSELGSYVKGKEDAGLEGAVVVQCAKDRIGEPSFQFAQTFKLKKYETIETVLLGLYVEDGAKGLSSCNLTGAMLGLFDHSVGCYLPVCKVNLDPQGRQIKTDGQRERLTRLRGDIAAMAASRQDASASIITLRKVFEYQGKVILNRLLNNSPYADSILALIDNMPRGQNLISLLNKYRAERSEFALGKGSKKASNKTDQCIFSNKELFECLLGMEQKRGYHRVTAYFSKSSDISAISKKLVKPDFLVSTQDPIILETRVFSIKWGQTPFSAGFHSWYCNSFVFENVFAERIRHDKKETTDFEVIHDFCRKRTPRKKRIVLRT